MIIVSSECKWFEDRSAVSMPQIFLFSTILLKFWGNRVIPTIYQQIRLKVYHPIRTYEDACTKMGQ